MRFMRNIAESLCLGYQFAKLRKNFEYTNIMQKNYTFTSYFCCSKRLFRTILPLSSSRNRRKKVTMIKKNKHSCETFSI